MTSVLEHYRAQARIAELEAENYALQDQVKGLQELMAGQSAMVVPEGWRDFIEECAATSGGMVNGNRLSNRAKELLTAAPAPAPGSASDRWRPMNTAPRDGTMLRLLVEFDDHPTEDTDGPAPTIGANKVYKWLDERRSMRVASLSAPATGQGDRRPIRMPTIDEFKSVLAEAEGVRDLSDVAHGWDEATERIARLNAPATGQDVSALVEALKETRQRVQLPDWARAKIDAALAAHKAGGGK